MESSKDPYTENLNFIERKGLDFLRRTCQREEMAVDMWSDEQIAEIRGIEHRAIRLAVITGAISGAIIAGFELGLSNWIVDDMDTADWKDLTPFWVAHLTTAGIITVIEIFYLYRLMLKSAARISAIGGLCLANNQGVDVIGIGISRAALDMPNPRTKIYGIDPYLRISRWKILLYTLAYRAKIGVTSIILRLMMRRLLARMALRTFLPFIAIPLYAVWNGVICYWTLREARGRVAAPVAIRQIEERMMNEPGDFDQDDKQLLISLIAETIIRARDSHPNFLLFLKSLSELPWMDTDSFDHAYDWKECCERLAGLDTRKQNLALDILQITVAMGGRPRRRQRKLVKEAFDACGRTFNADALNEVYVQFIRGQGITGLNSC